MEGRPLVAVACVRAWCGLDDALFLLLAGALLPDSDVLLLRCRERAGFRCCSTFCLSLSVTTGNKKLRFVLIPAIVASQLSNGNWELHASRVLPCLFNHEQKKNNAFDWEQRN